MLRDRGYDVTVYLDGVSRMDFEKMTDCDLLCYPVFAPAVNKVRESAQRVMYERKATYTDYHGRTAGMLFPRERC